MKIRQVHVGFTGWFLSDTKSLARSAPSASAPKPRSEGTAVGFGDLGGNISIIAFFRFFRVFPPLADPFDGLLLPLETFGADAMRGGCVESLLHEFFQPHPLLVVIDPPAPGANPHELFQVADAFQNPAGGHAHQKPDTQYQQHFQRGLAVQEGERVVGKNQ